MKIYLVTLVDNLSGLLGQVVVLGLGQVVFYASHVVARLYINNARDHGTFGHCCSINFLKTRAKKGNVLNFGEYRRQRIS